MTAWLVADTEDMSTNAALRDKCYWPNIQLLNNTPKPAKLVNRTTGTSGKYANEILSHLFEPFFRKLDTESSDCNSGKDVSKVYFFKDRPTLSMLHLTPSKVKMSRNCHSSSECILAFIMIDTLWSCKSLPYRCNLLNCSADCKLINFFFF